MAGETRDNEGMRRFELIVLLAAMTLSVMAIPAKRGPILRTMADGTEKEVYLHGDAFSHYMTDAKGVWLDPTTLEPMSEEARSARMESNVKRAKARRIQQEAQEGLIPNIAPRGLIIMVNFENKSFETSWETIDYMLNGDNFWRDYTFDYRYMGKTYNEHVECQGSARQYFKDQSYGAYEPIFDVVGPFTLSKEYSYYGKNDDARVGYMIKEACQMADAAGTDFTLYDNDDDGIVDFVYVMYAGFGEADGGPEETVWPHSYDLREFGFLCYCTVDGKDIGPYACSNEINYTSKVYNGIGTFCHEFSHVLGLPDLYETNQNPKGVHTLLEWDILDYGPYNNDGNTPPAYSAYERFYLGWLQPRILSAPQAVWMERLNSEKGDAILLCDGDYHNMVGYNPDPKVFYLIESRIQDGWDKFLPGPGVLITKISYDADDWVWNEVNNDKDKMGVDLIEAKPNYSNYGKKSDAFPYGATEWTDFAGHEVTEIEFDEIFGTTTFSYRGAAKNGVERCQVGDTEYSIQKILRDGQVLILRNGKEYTIWGNENH